MGASCAACRIRQLSVTLMALGPFVVGHAVESLDGEPGMCSAQLKEALQSLSRRDAVQLVEAFIRQDDTPSLLRSLSARSHGVERERWLPKDFTCLLRDLAETTLRWKPFQVKAVLVTGTVRSATLLNWQLAQFCAVADLIVLVIWTPEDDSFQLSTKEVPEFCEMRLLRVDSSSVDFNFDQTRLNSEELQDIEMRVGLTAIQRHFIPSAASPLSSGDIFVLKTRTDAYTPKPTIDHAFALNYSTPMGFLARPFLYRIWVPWVDALQPFYIVDDTFAGCLLDMWQLCFTHHYIPHGTLGPASTHVHRWLWPFLPWYSIAHEFRRNLYDLTNRMLHNSGENYHSFVIQLASQGRLRAEVDAHLIRLMAFYYRMLLVFFHVGRSDSHNGGVHLILNASAWVSEHSGHLLISTSVRCRPGNWGFIPNRLETFTADDVSVMAGTADQCSCGPANTSAGVVQISAVARHWARPVSSLTWLERMIEQVPEDGLTERIVSNMIANKLTPVHFTTPKGRWSMLQSGYREEELQTEWCLDLAGEMYFHEHPEESWTLNNYTFGTNGSDRGPVDWAHCCLPGLRTTSCWQSLDSEAYSLTPKAVEQACCFPAHTYCPRWLSHVGMQVLAKVAYTHPLYNSHVEAIEQNDVIESMYASVPHVCGADLWVRESLAALQCQSSELEKHAGSYLWVVLLHTCSARNLSRLIYPRSARAERLFIHRARKRAVTVRMQHLTTLSLTW